MPTVFIPPLLRTLSGGQESVRIEGKTIGEVIDRLEERFPGIKARLLEGDDLRRGLAVAVDANLARDGLRTTVTEKNEVHFIPALSGGQDS